MVTSTKAQAVSRPRRFQGDAELTEEDYDFVTYLKKERRWPTAEITRRAIEALREKLDRNEL